MRNGIKLGLFATIAASGFAVPAHADITGTIDATITLTAGCVINGQNFDDGGSAADFGAIVAARRGGREGQEWERPRSVSARTRARSTVAGFTS